jgi:hypothetical protein
MVESTCFVMTEHSHEDILSCWLHCLRLKGMFHTCTNIDQLPLLITGGWIMYHLCGDGIFAQPIPNQSQLAQVCPHGKFTSPVFPDAVPGAG